MCRRKSTYVTAILIPLAVGGLSALLSRNGMAAYQTLEKPSAVAPGSGVSHCMEHFVHINGNQFGHDLVFRKSGKTAGS